MAPDHDSKFRSDRLSIDAPAVNPPVIDPLSSYVQLVAPPRDSAVRATTYDTRAAIPTSEYTISSSLVVESLDDLLAEEYPLVGAHDFERMRESVELFISMVLEEVSRDSFIGPDGEFSTSRPISIRYGPARRGDHRSPLVWIEFRCQETEAYVLPNLKQGMIGVRWFSDYEERLPERFHDGPARLVLELDPSSNQVMMCRPLISPQCACEAESNFLVAVRMGDSAHASYLLSQYHDLIIARAVERGVFPSDALDVERRMFLRSLPRPKIVQTATLTNRERTVSLGYPGHEGSPGYIERVTFREVPVWGLRVAEIATEPVTRVP